MKLFLTLKPRQLFALLIGLPVILQIIAILFSSFGGNIAEVLIVECLVMMLSLVIFFGWFYALGTNLYQVLPPNADMHLTRFKLGIFFTVTYLAVFIGCMLWLFADASSSKPPNMAVIALIVALHLLSMFCIIYCLYFIARALKTVEMQRSVETREFLGGGALFGFSRLVSGLFSPE